MARLIQAGSDPRLYKVDTSGIFLPFQVPIPKPLTVGTELIVRGEVHDTFSINLMKGECSSGGFPEPGCLIHFNPRPDKKVIVINSAVDGKWQKEERYGHSSTFSRGGDFKVVIRMQALGYQILVDDDYRYDFIRKETQCSRAKYINIKGDVHIRSVEVRYQ